MATFNGSPAAAGDDAEWDTNSNFDNTATELHVKPQDFALETPGKLVAIRVPNVTIPSGSTITAAKFTLIAESTVDTSTSDYDLQGYDEDNSAQITDATDGDSRDFTTEAANGHFGSLTSGNAFDTFDFAAVVQEIIDRAGWSSGNAMQFRLSTDTGGSEEVSFASLDHLTHAAPVLSITYSAPGGGSSIAAIQHSYRQRRI